MVSAGSVAAMAGGLPHGPGSVSVIDFATRAVVAIWPIPDGGTPTWATSAPMVPTCGCQVASMGSPIGSAPRHVRSPRQNSTARADDLASTGALLRGPCRGHALIAQTRRAHDQYEFARQACRPPLSLGLSCRPELYEMQVCCTVQQDHGQSGLHSDEPLLRCSMNRMQCLLLVFAVMANAALAAEIMKTGFPGTSAITHSDDSQWE